MQAGIVGPEKKAVVRQQLGKHVPAATNTHETIVGRGVFYAIRVVSNSGDRQVGDIVIVVSRCIDYVLLKMVVLTETCKG
jgi:hypothetical protein